PGLVGAMAAGLMLGAPPGRAAVSWLTLVVPALLCFGFSRRPLRFGLGVGAILLAGTLHTSAQGKVIAARRSFFGVNRATAPVGLPAAGRRRPRRVRVVPVARRASLRSDRPRCLHLRRDPGAPPDARSARVVPRPPRPGGGARLPHLEPAPRPGARARRPGARCRARRAAPGRHARDAGRARGREAPLPLGGHGAPAGRPGRLDERRALGAAPRAGGRAGVDRRLLERARRAALALTPAPLSGSAAGACR